MKCDSLAVGLSVSILIVVFAGCQSEPAIFPVTGKVTLGGKTYSRLIVYMDPLEGAATRHNKGIGETDENGVLKLATSAGDGIAAGKYRVSFACFRSPKGGSFDAVNQKPGEAGNRKDGPGSNAPVNIVPEPYRSAENSPVEFTIGSGTNHYEFDIPKR